MRMGVRFLELVSERPAAPGGAGVKEAEPDNAGCRHDQARMTPDDAHRKAHPSARDANSREQPRHDTNGVAEWLSLDDHRGGLGDQPSIL